MTKEQLLQIDDVLSKLRMEFKTQKVTHAKFFYFVKRNSDILKSTVNKIRQELTISYARKREDREIEFETKRTELCVELSNKTEDGKPVIKDLKYDIKNQEEFKTKYLELTKEYEDIVKLQQDEAQKIQDILNQETEPVDFYMTSVNNLPSGDTAILTMEEIEILLPLIGD